MSTIGTAGHMYQDGVVSGRITDSEGEDKLGIISACHLNIGERVPDTTEELIKI